MAQGFEEPARRRRASSAAGGRRQSPRVRIGVSACLLGEEVRWNGEWFGKMAFGDVMELAAQLALRELVKVRVHPAAREGDETSVRSVAQQLASRTGSLLVEVRGSTALFYRRKRGAAATA